MRRVIAGTAAAASGVVLAALLGSACVGYLDVDAGARESDVALDGDRPSTPGGPEERGADAGTEGPAEGGAGPDAGCDYGCVVRGDKPLVYLRFEDDSASADALDSSENELHGAYPQAGVTKGAPGIVAGSAAVEFAGTGPQAIRMPPSADFDGPSPKFSVELWLKPDEDSGMRFIVDHEEFAPRGGWLVRTIDGRIGLELLKNDTHLATAEADEPLTLGEWHHVVISYDDAAGTGLIWIDGKLAKTAPMPSGVSLPTIGQWALGKQNCTPCQDNNFAGALDELAIYDRLLDQSIVDKHYRAARP